MSGEPPVKQGTTAVIKKGLYLGSQDAAGERSPSQPTSSNEPRAGQVAAHAALAGPRRISVGDLPWARTAGLQVARQPPIAVGGEQGAVSPAKAPVRAAAAPAAAAGGGEQFQHAFIPRGVNAKGQASDSAVARSLHNKAGAATTVVRPKQPAAAQQRPLQQPQQQQAGTHTAGSVGVPYPRWSAPGAPLTVAAAAAVPRSAQSDPYTGDDVKKRTQQWMQLAQQMRVSGDASEFVYLKWARPDALPPNPFDLQATTHADASAAGVYFTLSRAGFTRFTPDGSEFLPHDQWEREYLLHMQLMKLRVFQQYRLWRPFALWRKVVRDHKSAGSSAQLSSSLCWLKPVLRQALYAARVDCFRLEACGRSILDPGHPITLQQLSESLGQHMQELQAALVSVAAEVLATAKEACQIDLDLLAAQLMHQEATSMGVTGKQGTLLGATTESADGSKGNTGLSSSSSLMHSSALLASAAPGYVYGGGMLADVPYAVQAARRSEKRRLLAFVRRLELMVADGVRSAVLETVVGMWNAIRPAGHDDDAQPLQVTVLPMAADAAMASHGPSGPVLQLDVLMQPDAQLELSPGRQEWLDLLDSNRSSTVALARAAPRLVLAQELRPYLELPSEGLHLDAEGLSPIILGEGYGKAADAIHSELLHALTGAEAFSHGLEHLQQLVLRNSGVSREQLEHQVAAGVKGLPELRNDLQTYHAQLQSIQRMPAHRDLGILRVNLTKLKDAVSPFPQRCIKEIHVLLPRISAAAYDAFVGRIQDYTARLSRLPTTPEEFAEFLQLLREVEQQQKALDKEYDQVLAHYNLMEEFDVEVPSIQLAAVQDLESVLAAMRDAQWAAESAKDRLAQMFRTQLYERAKALQEQAQDLKLAAQDHCLLDGSTADQVAVDITSNLVDRVTQQLASAENIRRLMQMCGAPPPQFDLLEEVADDVQLKLALWSSKMQWATTTKSWMGSSFAQLDPTDMEDQVARIARAVHKFERSLPPNTATQPLRESVTEWQGVVPVVAALRNQHLKERHWERINALLCRHFDKTPGASLSDVLKMQVMDHSEAFVAISNEATQEAALEGLLAKILNRWRNIDFCLNPYKDIKDMYTLGALDEVFQALEDSRVTLSTILASRYVSGIRVEVDRVDQQLKMLSSLLDVWLRVQKGWMSLEAVFGAADIQRQLPQEARAFAQVDKVFKDIMRRTRDHPNALQCCNQAWLDSLTKCHENLEVIQRALEEYFEAKRMAFPRFYFLSNEELLDILSQVKHPPAVQPHLQKCFDGIRRLEMRQEEHGLELAAMLSAEGERVALSKPVKARGLVETWLNAVENSMHLTLRNLTKAALKEYGRQPREQWALSQPGQLVTLVSNIYWCQSVELAMGADQPPQELQDLHRACALQLAAMTSTVRGKLTDLERQAVVSLITADVHNRDVVAHLAHVGCRSAGDFEWQRQLRYEYDGDTDTVVIRQVNARFEYGNEYLGCPPRLVVTPVTERCYLTLTTALQLKLGGAPAGPAGTGKTETVKDLAKALGTQCVVFNCAEQMDHKLMARFFHGLAQCGAWACFDEFNRIDIEVLSVIAQQLLALQAALRSGTGSCLLDGRELQVLPSCGVFVTMNPGYAGRTELPDNLKALFRPVSMTVPDYSLVAEVILLSEGFDQARNLSNKVVQLYKLASEQLSQQDHYDFGMRALKSVLVMAGSLRRAAPDMEEAQLLLQAMLDANLPKFLSEDAVLFEAIVGDLFPNLQLAERDQEVLLGALTAACKALQLQPDAPFLRKAVQLQQTLGLRFGVMIVGPTGGGKTRCFEVLQAAMQQLHHEQVPGARPAATHMLNPKSITLAELYGSYNAMTNEWRDGLASRIIRTAAAADAGQDWHWVVFDGPVDTLWTESLNTVLDDNCMLCLPNGERIKLDASRLRMLFEVEDLAAASPATVSRCGMVYVPSDINGWQAAARSWVQRATRWDPAAGDAAAAADAPSSGAQAMSGFLWGLFDTCVQPLLDWINAHGRGPIGRNDAARIASMLHLLDAQLASQSSLLGPEVQLTSGNKVLLQYLFAFAAVWGLGGGLDSSCWAGWDKAVRAVFDGTANFPAGAGTVMDYFVDLQGGACFAPWADKVAPFSYNPEQPFWSILVPTVNTTRYTELLRLCCTIDTPVLFVGATGVGKSVVVQQYLASPSNMKTQLPVSLHCSARTSSSAVQQLLEQKLVRHGSTLAAPEGQRLVLFLDDMNLPAKEQYGAQPPLELLRCLQDQGGLYDRTTWQWRPVSNVLLLGACGPPGGGRQEMSARITRPFNVFCVAPPDEGSMRTVCSSILTGFLDHYFTPDVRSHTCKPVAEGCVEVFLAAQAHLLPTPARSHYVFSFRDVTRVLQGLLSIRVQQCGMDVRGTLQKLFVHEHLRVYGDRLVSNTELKWLEQVLWRLLRVKFDCRLTQDQVTNDNLMFGDFTRLGVSGAERVYEELPELPRLVKVLQAYLEEYNVSAGLRGGQGQLQLVLFRDAVQHIVQLSRILRQGRGHALLVGVAGTGKQTLARFAAYVADLEWQTIELRKGYGLQEFREDLKAAMRVAGVSGKPLAFLLTDSQMADPAFLGDINSLLNTGDITGLFTAEEVFKVLDDIRPWLTQQTGLPEGHEAAWGAFISRCRDNLHIILTMNPVGDGFRSRCRQFPSLTACATIDWYHAWPAEALLDVGSHFLEAFDLGSRQLTNQVAQLCVDAHQSAEVAATRFYQELRRYYYVTPKMFLDLISLYGSLLQTKQTELESARMRLLCGIQKLQETNAAVDTMTQELNDLQPLLAEQTEMTQRLLQQVKQEQEEAVAVAATVSAEEAEVSARTAETAALKDDAAADLAVVLPEMENAVKALDALNKADVIEMKTFLKPPALVQLTMEGVCLLLQERTDWDAAKRVLSDPTFIKRLVEYDKDNIPDKVVKALKRVVADPCFTPELVGKQSKAAMSMCMWVRAMDTYCTVYGIVEPKRRALEAAQAQLDSSNDILAGKRQQLQDINDKVRALQEQLLAKKAELASLQHQAQLSAERLSRAGVLTQLLGSEVGRWEETTAELGHQLERLTGDTFLCAACISYLGAFTGPYRAELVSQWEQRCQQLQVPASPAFNLSKLLVSPVELRDWALQGLPTDSVSVDNGTLVKRTHRWPLMVDPQEQGRRWVRTHEAASGLVVVRSGDPRLLQSLEACIRTGVPLLLDSCKEVLDPGLTPLLARRTFKHGGRLLIRLGEADVDYDPAFKLYMATSIANPHFLPETCIQVNLVNFTVTRKGLEDQLLGELVRQERPELEEQRDKLVVSIAADKKQLQELEDRVLKLLREAAGNILDDETLISTLNNAKATSAAIQARVKESEQTEAAINATRDEYRLPPARASLLWFVITDLPLLDPMYQYSLAYFCSLFKQCICNTPACSTLAARLEVLLDGMTSFMYRMVCRGLFEAHKQVFSLLIATAIQREAGVISPAEWDFLLRGQTASSSRSSCLGDTQAAAAEAAAPQWVPAGTWAAVQALASQVPAFAGLPEAMAANPAAWEGLLQGKCPAWSAGSSPEQQQGDAGLGNLAALWGAAAPTTAFQKVLLVKVLWPDSLLQVVQAYISSELGPAFLDPPASSLLQVYADSNPKAPIIFIMSQGMDPTSSLVRFAANQGRSTSHGLHLISLGQGQGPIAEDIVRMAVKAGDWVCLQNCHLAKSWMPQLQQLVEELTAMQVSMPPPGWRKAAAEPPPDEDPASMYPAEEELQRTSRSPSRLSTASTTRMSRTSSPAPGAPSPTPGKQAPTAAAVGPRGGKQQDNWVHPDFRLWLTSMPAQYFPVQVLQSGVKITLEAPNGVRANMLRCYSSLADSSLKACDSCSCGTQYRRLVFLLSLTHALLLERGRFGPIGWSKPYEFSDGDFSCSLQVLAGLLQHAAAERDSSIPAVAAAALAGTAAALPLAALQHMWGSIMYGGRVTDAADVRLLLVLLQQRLQPELLSGQGQLTASGAYTLPEDGSNVVHFESHIRSWPAADDLQLFGLHLNAGRALQQQEAKQLLDAVLSLQPCSVAVDSIAPSSNSRSSSSGGLDTGQQQALSGLVGELLEQLPQPLQQAEASILHDPFAPLPGGQVNSLGTVLRHEMQRYNQLLHLVAAGLQELAAALSGLVAMSADLELVAAALRDGRVPSSWQQQSYLSQQSLGPWMAGLVARVAWLRDWLSDGAPTSFWLSGLFFPEGFLTAVLQNHARTTHTPIDRVAFQFLVQPADQQPASISQAPSQGVYIHGLFLEAASWDTTQQVLVPALPRTTSCPLPVIHLLPVDTLVSPLRPHHPLEPPQQLQLGQRQRSQQITQQDAAQTSHHHPQQQQQAVSSSVPQYGWYECPLYKTAARSGALGSRGTSSALILYLLLPAPLEVQSSFWILQGTAAVCNPD